MKLLSAWANKVCLFAGILSTPALALASNNIGDLTPLFVPTSGSVSTTSSYQIITYGFTNNFHSSWTASSSSLQNTLVSLHGKVTGSQYDLVSFMLCNSGGESLSAIEHTFFIGSSTPRPVDFDEVLSISGTSQDIYVCWKNNTSSAVTIDSNSPFTLSHLDKL